jgi:TldD protein
MAAALDTTNQASRSSLYRAPFAAGGASAVDEALAQRLLAVALSRGGDYADLFFEYRAAGSLVYDEGILKSASRGVSMGVGVRVLKGDATGYAYVEQLDWDAMKRAAETAAQIASGGGAQVPAVAVPVPRPNRYALDRVTLDVPGMDKRRLLERAAAAAHAYDPLVVKAEASLSEEIREILVFTSDGLMASDTQPLMRFGVRAIVEKDGKRQEGSSGGGGRTSLGYFEGKTPEWHAREAARQAITMLGAQEAPAGQMEVVLAPGDSGILLHEAVGTGSRPTSTARAPATTRARSESPSRASCAPWWTTPRSPRAAEASTSTTRATSPRRASSSRAASSRRTCTIA